MVNTAKEKILVVESDPVIANLVAEQALKAAGYQVEVVADTSLAIRRAVQNVFDALIVNLNMPGLSGKDLMVALSAQRVDTPIVVVATKGMESYVIQAFRLGAADYLLYPVREAEVLNVVDRVLKQSRERRERDRLALQLQQSNQDLQGRMREMNTLFSVGKAVTSMTDANALFDRILESAARVTQSDRGWFLLRNEVSSALELSAGYNLPASLTKMMGEPWEDSISSLVVTSGESLSLGAEALKKVKLLGSLGQAVLISPVKLQKQVAGLLAVARQQAIPFNQNEQSLLDAMADYASIALVNARQFRGAEDRTRSSQAVTQDIRTGEKVIARLLTTLHNELVAPLEAARASFSGLMQGDQSALSAEQHSQASALRGNLDKLAQIVEAIDPLIASQEQPNLYYVNLNEMARQTVNRFLPFAQANQINMMVDLPPKPVIAQGDMAQIVQVLDGLVSNAIKFNKPGGQVAVKVEQASYQMAHVSVSDTGVGIPPRQTGRLFEAANRTNEAPQEHLFAGLGIGLDLVKEIIISQRGEIWVESKPDQGSKFHFTLPVYK